MSTCIVPLQLKACCVVCCTVLRVNENKLSVRCYTFGFEKFQMCLDLQSCLFVLEITLCS